MVDTNSPPSCRAPAADSVLDHAQQAIEIEDGNPCSEVEFAGQSIKLNRAERWKKASPYPVLYLAPPRPCDSAGAGPRNVTARCRSDNWPDTHSVSGNSFYFGPNRPRQTVNWNRLHASIRSPDRCFQQPGLLEYSTQRVELIA
jgi:hypothetical protein